MWNDSDLEIHLHDLIGDEDEVAQYCLYSDLAYWSVFGIMGPYHPSGNAMELSLAELAANETMLCICIVIESGFGITVNYWCINNYKWGSKLGLSLVALYYIILTLFTKFDTCLHWRNLVSD